MATYRLSRGYCVSWDAQVQKAVDCYNAGASVLHIHVRDPKTGKISKDFSEYNYLMERLRQAVPEIVLEIGGSISFAPSGEGEKAKWLGYDTRHMLAEITPNPDQITIAIGSAAMNIVDMTTEDDVKGTQLEDPKMRNAYADMIAEAGPSFYLEHLKRLKTNDIQPFFMLGHVHQLETVERLIRAGAYAGPLNHAVVAIGGGAAGRNPFDMMEYIRRSPRRLRDVHGVLATYDVPVVHSGDRPRDAHPGWHRGHNLGHKEGRENGDGQADRKDGADCEGTRSRGGHW